MIAIAPPGSLAELEQRARSLEGRTIADVANALGRPVPGGGVHTKGRAGELVEAALGATGGSAKVHDFPELGVELKTIPIDEKGKPLESTFVCAVRLDEDIDFDASWVKAKLARVLFVPVVGDRKSRLPERRFGRAMVWEPTAEQIADLAFDYDEIMGLVGIGRIEDVSAHLGKCLQLRPKAKDGSVRTVALGEDGDRIETVPRGFYLRTGFTAALLASG